MRLFIPTIGTKLKLLEDWNFDIFYESRNETYFKAFHLEWDDVNTFVNIVRNKSIKHCLPKDSILIVDRMFIRQKMSGYDSVTFRLKDYGGTGKVSGEVKSWSNKSVKKQVRFWAKLNDVNTMECEVV